jgi:hypothetical protein
MEEKLNKISQDEIKKQEKNYENKMKALKNEEDAVRDMFKKKHDKEWTELKKDTKDLVSKKQKDLEDLYDKMYAKKVKDVEKASTEENKKLQKMEEKKLEKAYAEKDAMV